QLSADCRDGCLVDERQTRLRVALPNERGALVVQAQRHQVPILEATAELECPLRMADRRVEVAHGECKARAHSFQVAALRGILLLRKQALGAGQPGSLQAGALELVVARQVQRAQRGGALISLLEPSRIRA